VTIRARPRLPRASATVYLKMLNIELAREWSLRALAECPLEAKDVRFYIEHNQGVIDEVAKKQL
jgi:hypothetical protein